MKSKVPLPSVDASCRKSSKNQQVDGNAYSCGLNEVLLKSNTSRNGGLLILDYCFIVFVWVLHEH